MRLDTYIQKEKFTIEPPGIPEHIPFVNCMSNNNSVLTVRVRSYAQKNGFNIEVLGTLKNSENDDIMLITHSAEKNDPYLLIAGGFHGDEQAPPWAILKYLMELNEKDIKNINLAILPLVNPSGFRKTTRLNYMNQDPNSNYWYNNSNELPSEEGYILLKNFEKLKCFAKNGFITLHEDDVTNNFYLHTYQNKINSSFIDILMKAGTKYMKVQSGKYIDGFPANNGIIISERPSTFEDYLYHNGVLLTACTETPTKKNINMRIDTNLNIIREIVNYTITRKRL